MSELRDFLRSMGGLAYGLVVLMAAGFVISMAVIAWRWLAVAG